MNTVLIASSAPLDAAEKKRIEKIFSAKHAEEVDFSYTVEPALLGGLLVIDGDNFYDGSVRGQLNKLKKTL